MRPRASASASARAEVPPPPQASGLIPRRSGDGSFSLWCPQIAEAFHSADGAVAEARRVFVRPAALERFAAGHRLRVVEVAVGTGTNTAALLEAALPLGLDLDWWGLELDPAPLRLALADAGFQRQWRPGTLEHLQQLTSGPRLLWGDARQRVMDLLLGRHSASLQQRRAGGMLQAPALCSPAPAEAPEGREPLAGQCDLVLLDAFSPQRCPGLWSLEFLGRLAGLLAPQGRLLTYCSAAAVRAALERSGLQLAAIHPVGQPQVAGSNRALWSAGTAASPCPLPADPPLRALTRMEREHMACRAGEPYRDPTGMADSASILTERQLRQACSQAEPASHWQRRWGVARRHRNLRPTVPSFGSNAADLETPAASGARHPAANDG